INHSQAPVGMEQMGAAAFTQNYIAGALMVSSAFKKNKKDVGTLQFEALVKMLSSIQDQLQTIDRRLFRLTKISIENFEALAKSNQNIRIDTAKIERDLEAASGSINYGIELQLKLAQSQSDRARAELRQNCYRPLLYERKVSPSRSSECMEKAFIIGIYDSVNFANIRVSSSDDEDGIFRALGANLSKPASFIDSASSLNALNLGIKKQFEFTDEKLMPSVVPHVLTWQDSTATFFALAPFEPEFESLKNGKARELAEKGEQISRFMDVVIQSRSLGAAMQNKQRQLAQSILAMNDSLNGILEAEGSLGAKSGSKLGREFDEGLLPCNGGSDDERIWLKNPKTFRSYVPRDAWILESLELGKVTACYKAETWWDTLDDEYLHFDEARSTNQVNSKIDVTVVMEFVPNIPIRYPELPSKAYGFNNDQISKYIKSLIQSGRSEVNLSKDLRDLKPIPIFSGTVSTTHYHLIGPLSADKDAARKSANRWAQRLFNSENPCGNHPYTCFSNRQRIDGNYYPISEPGENLAVKFSENFVITSKSLSDRYSQTIFALVRQKLVTEILKDRAFIWQNRLGKFAPAFSESLVEAAGPENQKLLIPLPLALVEASARMKPRYSDFFDHYEHISESLSKLGLIVQNVSRVREISGVENELCFVRVQMLETREAITELLWRRFENPALSDASILRQYLQDLGVFANGACAPAGARPSSITNLVSGMAALDELAKRSLKQDDKKMAFGRMLPIFVLTFAIVGVLLWILAKEKMTRSLWYKIRGFEHSKTFKNLSYMYQSIMAIIDKIKAKIRNKSKGF
ncbi:MAG: hypothetical protein ACKVOS_04420, partial [Sphingorhabdus sp.]|uniref:hypothetical protein n=1 Tax=Sphingorhabdus sp. TaxID=1902408 RepID=UPI0038FC756F